MTIETKIAQSATEAVEILNSLNFRQVSFEFYGENYSDDYKTAYRHFDGIDAKGNGTCFALIEIVINGKLETVRFINTYRETAVDIKIGNANYTVDDKGAVELIDEPEMKNQTTNAVSTPAIKVDEEFKVGTVYEDFTCGKGYTSYKVTARTAKFVTVANLTDGTEKRCKIDFEQKKYYANGYHTVEFISPDKKANGFSASDIDHKAMQQIKAALVEDIVNEYAVSPEAQDAAVDADSNVEVIARDENGEVEKVKSGNYIYKTRNTEYTAGVEHFWELYHEVAGLDEGAAIAISLGIHGAKFQAELINYLEGKLVDDYAVSPEAQDAAVDAEIEQAANAVVEVSEEPKTTSKIDADVAEYQAKFDGAVADSNVDDSATLTINGERIEFGEGKLNKIVAPKLDAEITFGNGKKTFHYRGTVQSKAEFFKRLDELADIRAQIAAVENFKKTHGACMITAHCDFRAPFVAIVHVVIKSGEQSREKHFAGDFLTFDGAKKFVDDFKTFAGEMKFFAAIKRDSTNGEECYKRDFDGNETIAEEFTIPNAATSETKEELREKASELADLKERLDKEKSFVECARNKLEFGQVWMRAASKKSDSADFYAEQITTTDATIKELNERITELTAQITAVEAELDTVNKKIATMKKAA